MPEPSRASVIEKLMLATFVGAAVAGFAMSQATLPAWFLLVPCAVGLFVEVKSVPAIVKTGARTLAWGAVAGVLVLGMFFMAYPILPTPTTLILTLVAGYTLGAFSTLFFLGRSVWPVSSTLFPSTLGTLVVASFNPSAPLRGNLTVAGAAVFAWLALQRPLHQRLARKGFWDLRGVIGLAASAVGTFLIAWGIIRVLPWAQLQVERGMFSFFSTSATHYSVLSGDARLGDLAQLKLSKKVVMRVWTSRPQKLRGWVFTEFDGAGWHPRGLTYHPLLPVASAAFQTGKVGEWLDVIPGSVFLMPGRTAAEVRSADVILTKVVQALSNSGMLVSPGEKLLVRVPVSQLGIDRFGRLIPRLISGIQIYGVVNRRTRDVVEAGEAPPQAIQECLALPADTDPRLRELAASLAEKAATPAERVQRTLDYLQSQCHYSLTVGRFHSRQPVAEFLFEKKQGYCEYFASAAAVLLRLEGVPCRYVTGFSVQDGNRQAGHYVVREADAHAWIEAYIPGQGWVEVDPTPEAEYQALHADLPGGSWAAAMEWLQTEMEELSIRVRGGDWRAGLRWVWIPMKAFLRALFLEHPGLSVLLLGLLAVVIGLRKRKKRKASQRLLPRAARLEGGPLTRELAQLLIVLDELWARQGHVRPASRAPLEHLASLPSASAELRAASQKVIDCLYRCWFGGVQIPPAEIEALRRELERAAAL